MSKEQTSDLLKFLKPFGDDIKERALWLREFVWDLYPKTNELNYDNYNALAFGWSPTDRVGPTFCSVAVGRSSHNVHYGFYWGSELSDPKWLLLGEGDQFRYILGFPQSLHYETGQSGLRKFTCEGERQEANLARGDDHEINLNEQKRIWPR